MSIHQFCIDKKYVKKQECNTIDIHENGKYQIFGLKDYIDMINKSQDQIEDKDKFKFTIENINEIEHLVLFRVDYIYFFDNDILSYYKSYNDRMNDYYLSDTNIYPESGLPIISYSEPQQKYTDLNKAFRWGNEPSIGINVGTREILVKEYISKKVEKNPKKEFVFIKLFLPINNDIKVCAIPFYCRWKHITCDKLVNEKYDLIGHLPYNMYDFYKNSGSEAGNVYQFKSSDIRINHELNILDNGRKFITKYTIQKCVVNDRGGIIYLPDIKTIFLNKKLENTDFKQKYLKYKQKYLNLKNKYNFSIYFK